MWTLTLAHIEALEERRNIRQRYERFNAALSASAIYNVNRGKETKPLSPFDFVPGMEEKIDPASQKRAEAVRNIAVAISRVPLDISAEEFQALRAKMEQRLNEQGLDGEQILKEVLREV